MCRWSFKNRQQHRGVVCFFVFVCLYVLPHSFSVCLGWIPVITAFLSWIHFYRRATAANVGTSVLSTFTKAQWTRQGGDCFFGQVWEPRLKKVKTLIQDRTGWGWSQVGTPLRSSDSRGFLLFLAVTDLTTVVKHVRMHTQTHTENTHQKHTHAQEEGCL